MLLALADELGNFVDYVGGAEHAHILLGPLENLAAVEETVVREKVGARVPLVRWISELFWQAVESLGKIVAILSQKQVEENFMPLIKRLTGGDWFTSRTSACGLYAAVYPKCANGTQDELRK